MFCEVVLAGAKVQLLVDVGQDHYYRLLKYNNWASSATTKYNKSRRRSQASNFNYRTSTTIV